VPYKPVVPDAGGSAQPVDTVASFVKAQWYWVLPLAALVIWSVVL
jgi:hypothetical protein